MSTKNNPIDSSLKKTGWTTRWFGSRMLVADKVSLEQRSTYILPTKAGFLMFAVIILMMIGATNYQNNLAFLLTFLIAAIGLVSILFTFKNLQGLIFSKGQALSVCMGEEVFVNVLVQSQSQASHHTIAISFEEQSCYYCDVNNPNGTTVSLSIMTNHRGWFYLPRIKVSSDFPFGLLGVWSWFKFSTPILIYPKPIEPSLAMSSGNFDEDEGQQVVSGIDDLYGLKTYQSGDPVSRIDWKALARERGLFTKEFVSYQNNDLVFSWNDFISIDDELRLSYLTHLIIAASKSNLEYSLIMPSQKIDKNSGELHRRQCLELLALYGLVERVK